MEFEHLGWKEEEDGVVILSLRNPPVNALSTSLLSDLDRAVRALSQDPAKRAAILTGEGQYFSAGADVKEMATLADRFRTEAPNLVRRVQSTFRAVETLPLPVVAAINGLAVGGGLELALSCDLRIAGDSARVGFPEVTLGLIPAYGGTQRLARLVGTAKARELVFTGSLIPAAEAARWGLVNRTVPSGQELRAARDLAHNLATRSSPVAVRAAKRAILEGYDRSLEEGLQRETQLFESEVLPSQDLLEGIVAFVEKRPPKFSGH
jgi:enoyl-CoA hydratase/carnithine racemase